MLPVVSTLIRIEPFETKDRARGGMMYVLHGDMLRASKKAKQKREVGRQTDSSYTVMPIN